MLHLKGMGGILILYKEYVDANLTIPALPIYNKDILFLAVLDHKYGESILVQIGTQVIDHLVVIMTKKNYNRLGKPGNR